MKKSIICYLLCFLMLFSASCSISLTNGSVEEPEFDNLIDPEDSPYYFVLDEDVKAEISAYVGKEFTYACYYGEHEGKHVFGSVRPTGVANGGMLVSGFCLSASGSPYLVVWDGNALIQYDYSCDIFSFETAKEIAIIHQNHFVNGCRGYCYFRQDRQDKEIKEAPYSTLLRPVVNWSLEGDYGLKGYWGEQDSLFSGELDVVLESVILPGEVEETETYVITIENTKDNEEKLAYYGTVASIDRAFQLTEDMWLDSYGEVSQAEETELLRAKSIKVCMPIITAEPTELNVELYIACERIPYESSEDFYLLIIKADEETGKKYVSGIYYYKEIE